MNSDAGFKQAKCACDLLRRAEGIIVEAQLPLLGFCPDQNAPLEDVRKALRCVQMVVEDRCAKLWKGTSGGEAFDQQAKDIVSGLERIKPVGQKTDETPCANGHPGRQT